MTEFKSKYQKIIIVKLTLIPVTDHIPTLPRYITPGREESTLTHPQRISNKHTYFQLFLHPQLGERLLDSYYLKKKLQMVSGQHEITSTQACHVYLGQTAVLSHVLL